MPHTEFIALDKKDSIADHFEIIKREKYTRYPVIEGDKDHIVGMVAHYRGMRIRGVNAKNTSALAFDGSGEVKQTQ